VWPWLAAVAVRSEVFSLCGKPSVVACCHIVQQLRTEGAVESSTGCCLCAQCGIVGWMVGREAQRAHSLCPL
jgi:hypothetical protein